MRGNKVLLISSLLISLIVACPGYCDELESSPTWRGGPHFGFSPFMGALGAEIQKGHFGLTIGIPASVGIKYYPDNQGYRWFFGAHAMNYNIDDEDTEEDGIIYEEEENTLIGFGFGYKWLWKSKWDLNLGISITHFEEELSNDYMTRTETSIRLLPTITFGYTF